MRMLCLLFAFQNTKAKNWQVIESEPHFEQLLCICTFECLVSLSIIPVAITFSQLDIAFFKCCTVHNNNDRLSFPKAQAIRIEIVAPFAVRTFCSVRFGLV